jgi:endoglucanase
VSDLLGDVAGSEGIPHGFEVYASETYTDADDIHAARAGVPTGLISIPTRYLHSPNEMCDLADVEAIIGLIAAFASRLAPDTSFVR